MTREEFIEFLNSEPDTFRLTIRGHAAIDGKLDEILVDAFPGGLPEFLRGPSFDRKMQLVMALGLVPSDFADPVGRLTRLRNLFSHGKLLELDEKGAKDLAHGVKVIAPALDVPSLPTHDPRAILTIALGIV